jgi:hypothetical protein
MEKQPKPVGFQPGHVRYGGKKKRTAQAARELADSLGCDPLRFMMSLIDNDTYMQTEIGPDGKKRKVEVAVTMDLRLDAAKTVVNYLYPRLNAQHVTSDPSVRLEATIDINRMMQDPDLVDAAQRLSLAANNGTLDAEWERLPTFTGNRLPNGKPWRDGGPDV